MPLHLPCPLRNSGKGIISLLAPGLQGSGGLLFPGTARNLVLDTFRDRGHQFQLFLIFFSQSQVSVEMILPEENHLLKPEDPASSALFPGLACTCNFHSYGCQGSLYPYRHDHLPVSTMIKIQRASPPHPFIGLLAVLYSAWEGLSTAEGLGNIKNPRFHSQP